MLNTNVIYNDDCLGENGMKILPDNSIDTIIADLPYGTTIAKWDSILPLDELWEQYKRVLKKNGVIVLFGSQPFTSKLILSNVEWFKEELVWSKDRASNFAQAKRRHLKYHENIVVFSNGQYAYNRQMQERLSERVAQHQKSGYVEKSRKAKDDGTEVVFTNNYEGRSFDVYDANVKNPSSVIVCPIVNPNGKEKLKHSTQKPLRLVEYLVRTFSNEGDVVLDNVIGSGTTAIACINTGRKYIGWEKELEYYEMTTKRIAEHSL